MGRPLRRGFHASSIPSSGKIRTVNGLSSNITHRMGRFPTLSASLLRYPIDPSEQVLEAWIGPQVVKPGLGFEPDQPDVALFAGLLEAFEPFVLLSQPGVDDGTPIVRDVPALDNLPQLRQGLVGRLPSAGTSLTIGVPS